MAVERLYMYCLFCETGAETRVTKWIAELYPGIRALALEQEKHKVVGGTRALIKWMCLPGYVFLYASEPMRFEKIQLMSKAYFLLRYDDDTLELRGEDRRFAEWVYENDGLLVCSTAMQVGDQCEIVAGPLTRMRGQIAKIDKHNRNAKVELRFASRVWTAWLPFDWMKSEAVEKLAPTQGTDESHEGGVRPPAANHAL